MIHSEIPDDGVSTRPTSAPAPVYPLFCTVAFLDSFVDEQVA